MQAAYGEKYDLMMFDSKRDVTNLLREVMETHSAREFLCRKEKDAGTAAEKTDIMNSCDIVISAHQLVVHIQEDLQHVAFLQLKDVYKRQVPYSRPRCGKSAPAGKSFSAG